MGRYNEDIEKLCIKLRLGKGVREALKGEEAEPHIDFIEKALVDEIDGRRVRLAKRLIKRAKFPFTKTIEEFDDTEVNFPADVTSDYFYDGAYLDDKASLFLYGKPGTGKTHLAVALGIEACKRNKRVHFFRMQEFVELAIESTSNQSVLKHLKKTDLLILDEFGFMKPDNKSLAALFEVYSSMVYEKMSVILTSNLNYSEWLELFNSKQKQADALLDRIVHHAFTFEFFGGSHRLKNSPLSA